MSITVNPVNDPPVAVDDAMDVYKNVADRPLDVLVNDHDPRPLRYQFKHEREGLFGWEYLEEGPTVWKVRISRQETT